MATVVEKFPVNGSVSAQFTVLLDASFRQSNKKPPKKHKTSSKGERTMKLEDGEKLHPNNFLKEKYTSVNICICDEPTKCGYLHGQPHWATVRNLNMKEWRESFSRFLLMCFNETGNYVHERQRGKTGIRCRSTNHPKHPLALCRYNIHETIHKFANTRVLLDYWLSASFTLHCKNTSSYQKNNMLFLYMPYDLCYFNHTCKIYNNVHTYLIFTKWFPCLPTKCQDCFKTQK